MQKLKFGFIIFLLLIAVYAVSMYFVDENKTIKIEKTVNYPIEKVYPQFANLQKFSSWNDFFVQKKNVLFNFFTPYEGQGSSMTYKDQKSFGNSGEISIPYAKPDKAIRYHLFQNKNGKPYVIDVVFKQTAPNQTLTTWLVHTPKLPLFKRYLNFFSEDLVSGNIEKSINNLSALMSNKVDKENKMALIKFDSLMVENLEGQLILGINVNAQNRKDELFKNIVINHNKVKNFIMMDLGKKDDEFGVPVMLTDPNNFKDKEISYYYGFPLSKRIGISDNNFSFRTLNASKAYIIYYKGNFGGRIRSIQQLLQKAKKDSMRNGELQETFMEEPDENKDCVLKIALPVYR